MSRRNLFVAIVFMLFGDVSVAFSELRFAVTAIQLGEIRGGAPLSQSFPFVNSAKTPVEIVEMRPGCGCLRPRLDKTRIEPGETGELAVEINTLGQPAGPHTWRMQVLTRCDGRLHERTLEVTARVVTEVTVQPASLTLDAQKPATHQVVLTDLRDKPLTIVAVKTTQLRSRSLEPQRNELKHWQFRIQLDVPADLPEGRHDETLHIYTSDPLYQHLKVPITLIKQSRARVAAQPEAVTLRGSAGQPIPARLVRLSDRGEQAIVVDKIVADDPALLCSWVQGPGNAATVKIQVDPARLNESSLNCTVRIHLSAPVTEIVTIPVSLVID